MRLNTLVTDRHTADEMFAAWQTEQARIRWLGASPPEQDHTVLELLHEYHAKVTPLKSVDSQRRDRGVLGRFSEEWGPLLLNEVTPKMIEDHIADRLEAVSFATVSKELGIVKSAFSRAVRWGWASRSPFAGIVLNQEGQDRIRWLTELEENRLLAHCSAWLRDFVIVGIDTGLRRANLVGLQRSWVHNGSLLIVPRTKIKSKKCPLAVPLTKRAAMTVQRHMTRSVGDLLFVRDDGLPYRPDQVTMPFHRAAESAGLVEVCLHTLRHSFISRLVQAGRPLAEVAALAGHRDIRMTMRYAHLAPSHLEQGIQSLESIHRTYLHAQ